MKSLPELIFDNIEKTHQAPRCKVCKKTFPRLNQKIGVCKKCLSNKGKNLNRWLK